MLSGVNFRSASLVGLLILMVLAPLAVAEPAENGLELKVEIDAPENGLYFSDTSDLEVTLRIKNHADNCRAVVRFPPGIASNCERLGWGAVIALNR